MSMFEKYGDNSYTAYNLTPKKLSNTIKKVFSSPIVGYDQYGNAKAFIWDPNDVFTLKLSLGSNILVYENSLIYETSGLKPTSTTVGVKGQKAYNTVDGKSWICKGTLKENFSSDDWIPIGNEELEELPDWIPIATRNMLLKARTFEEVQAIVEKSEQYIWEEDPVLTFPVTGTKSITIIPNMEGKVFSVTLQNFRHEVIYEYQFENTHKCEIFIGKDKTPLLVEGQFFINTCISDDLGTFQQNLYEVTIIENPSKYINITRDDYKVQYEFTKTIQPGGKSDFIWEPIGNSSGDDFVWVPINIRKRTS